MEKEHVTEAIDAVRKEMNWFGDTICDFNKQLDDIDNANTPEEAAIKLLDIKQNYMLVLLNAFPLGNYTCTYCIEHKRLGSYGLYNCEKCEYGKIKGSCDQKDSAYRLIKDAKEKLKELLKNYAITPEEIGTKQEKKCKCNDTEVKVGDRVRETGDYPNKNLYPNKPYCGIVEDIRPYGPLVRFHNGGCNRYDNFKYLQKCTCTDCHDCSHYRCPTCGELKK